MNKWLIAGATAAGLVISSAAMARVDVGISIGVPGVVYPAAPVYVAPPPPVYVAPAPVYAPPLPVYYRPAPVYVAPPVIYPAPVYYTRRRPLLARSWRLLPSRRLGHGHGHRR